MADWQPIETAPKDGSYIIAGRFRNGDELCWVKHSRWLTPEDILEYEGEGAAEDYEAGWSDGNDDSELCYPTHWISLPAPQVPA
jgi:hypothetical protein